MTPSKEAREIVAELKRLGLIDPVWEYPTTCHIDETLAPHRERVRRLVEALPTVPHPGGRLVCHSRIAVDRRSIAVRSPRLAVSAME